MQKSGVQIYARVQIKKFGAFLCWPCGLVNGSKVQLSSWQKTLLTKKNLLPEFLIIYKSIMCNPIGQFQAFRNYKKLGKMGLQ